jgi:hypothetical protein
MLACGENEKDQAIAALNAQDHDDWDFFLIENKENKVAHEELYSRFEASANSYHLFLKLDADTVFRRTSALREISAMFDSRPDAAGILVDLLDFYSNSLLPGLMITTGDVRWPRTADKLMVDSYYRTRGEMLHISSEESAVAAHSPDPSPLQAFRFGVHRATKAIQNDRPVAERWVEKAQMQWQLLELVWQNFLRTRDRRIGMAVAGAEFVISGSGASYVRNYMDPAVAAAFEDGIGSVSDKELFDRLAVTWGDTNRNAARWRESLDAK